MMPVLFQLIGNSKVLGKIVSKSHVPDKER